MKRVCRINLDLMEDSSDSSSDEQNLASIRDSALLKDDSTGKLVAEILAETKGKPLFF